MWATIQKLRIGASVMPQYSGHLIEFRWRSGGNRSILRRPARRRALGRVPLHRTVHPPHPWRYDAMMVVVSLIWGINFSVTKSALDEIPVFAFAGLRFLGATLLLTGVLLWREGWRPIPAPVVRRLIGLGILGNTLYQIGFMTGLHQTTATNSSVLIAFIPVVVAVLGGLLRIETPTPAARWALLVGTVGVLLVVLGREGAGGNLSLGGDTLRGDLLTLSSVVFWALFTLGVRRVGAGLSPLQVTTVTTAAGMPGLLLLGVPDLLRLDWAAVPASAWGSLLYASFVSIVVAYFLWNRSVQVLGTNHTSLYACVTPVFAAAAAALLLGERLGPTQIAGGGLVVGSVLLSRFRRRIPAALRSRATPPGAPSPGADAG